jgi:hypothetical protein
MVTTSQRQIPWTLDNAYPSTWVGERQVPDILLTPPEILGNLEILDHRPGAVHDPSNAIPSQDTRKVLVNLGKEFDITRPTSHKIGKQNCITKLLILVT